MKLKIQKQPEKIRNVAFKTNGKKTKQNVILKTKAEIKLHEAK